MLRPVWPPWLGSCWLRRKHPRHLTHTCTTSRRRISYEPLTCSSRAHGSWTVKAVSASHERSVAAGDPQRDAVLRWRVGACQLYARSTPRPRRHRRFRLVACSVSRWLLVRQFIPAPWLTHHHHPPHAIFNASFCAAGVRVVPEAAVYQPQYRVVRCSALSACVAAAADSNHLLRFRAGTTFVSSRKRRKASLGRRARSPQTWFRSRKRYVPHIRQILAL